MTNANVLSVVLVSLMKGIADRENDPVLWQSLTSIQARVRDYVACLGLDLVLDEAEGYAYLRQRPAEEGAPEIPRLGPSRQLGFPVSLMPALPPKKLAGVHATSGDPP